MGIWKYDFVNKRGFTLIELVTVVALISLILSFLVKFDFFKNQNTTQLNSGIKMLSSIFNDAKYEAIFNSSQTKIAVDISSKYKFRRVIHLKKTGNKYYPVTEILLPERIFIMSKEKLEEILTNKTLNTFLFEEETITYMGTELSVYMYTFSSNGRLTNSSGNFDNNTAILGLGYGKNPSDEIIFENINLTKGLFITQSGKIITLKSKTDIEGAI